MRRSHVDFIDGNRTTATAPEPEAEIWDQYPWQEARPTNDEVDERAEMANFWGQSRLQQF
jgi:hypothetical protein